MKEHLEHVKDVSGRLPENVVAISFAISSTKKFLTSVLILGIIYLINE